MDTKKNFLVISARVFWLALLAWAIYIHIELNKVEQQVDKCINQKPKVDTIVVEQKADTVVQVLMPYEVYDAP